MHLRIENMNVKPAAVHDIQGHTQSAIYIPCTCTWPPAGVSSHHPQSEVGHIWRLVRVLMADYPVASGHIGPTLMLQDADPLNP